MKKFSVVAVFFLCNSLYAQIAPSIEWQKCLGGSDDDAVGSIQKTFDGGFIVAGVSSSTDGDVSGNIGYADAWIVKLDSVGNIVWEKSYGGTLNENAKKIRQTSDSGYVFVGSSNSNDVDVSGNHVSIDDYGDTTNTQDCWVVKLNAAGNIMWQKSLGGSDYDYPGDIQQTTDGGFIIAGSSSSSDGDVPGNYSYYDWYYGYWTFFNYVDYWIVRLDANGNIIWSKHFGGTDADAATSVQQCVGGGFIVAGGASSYDYDVLENHGYNDYWVLKLDDNGNLVWQKTFSGSCIDAPFAMRLTSDHGIALAGFSCSNDFDVTGNHGGEDFWVFNWKFTLAKKFRRIWL